jgi:hypothetical protein
MDREPRSGGFGSLVQGFRKGPIRNQGNKPVPDNFGNFPGQGLGKEKNWRRNAAPAELRAFVRRRHGKAERAGSKGGFGNPQDTVTVGVGLDRHADPAIRANPFPDGAEVFQKMIYVDSCPDSSHGLILSKKVPLLNQTSE